MGLKEQLLEADEKAQASLDAVLKLPELNLADAYPEIRRYVLARFLLEDHETLGDSIAELAKESIARSLNMKKEEITEFDVPNCQGATAVVDKKVLLILRIKREFGVSFSSEESTSLQTLTQLAELLCEKLAQKRKGE